MCARFFRHEVSWEDYFGALNLLVPEGVEPPEAAYNIAPTQYVPILRKGIEGEAERTRLRLEPARWGIVPSWWTKPISEMQAPVINARCETVAEKPFFRGAFRHRRCLVPVSGFYEWSGEKGNKQAFAIGLRNRRWFCFAGLWDRALIEGSEIDSFTLLTTRPNDVMAGIHTRMPVILNPQDYEAWLDPQNKRVEALYEPFAAEDTHAWPIAAAVGNVRNQGPDLIAEV